MDAIDNVTFDVPLLVRLLEYAREELPSDEALHVFVERIITASKAHGVLTMANYKELVPMKISAAARLMAEKWSQDVETKHHTPEGLFKKDAKSIAQGLKKQHPDLKGAMSALNFYINRAGQDVPNKDNLEKAKDELRKIYGQD